MCSKKGNSYTCWWLIYTFPLLLLLLSFSLWVSISCDHLLSIFPPICLCLLFVLIPFHTALLSLSLLCLRGTHFIFLVHIHILVQLLNFYLLIIAGLSLCAAAFWRMGGTAAPERESVCVCVRKRGRQKEKEREKLPIMFPLWVSVCLLLSVAFSEPQYHVVLINFPGSVLKTPHSASPLHINKRSFACMRLCLCVCRYEI